MSGLLVGADAAATDAPAALHLTRTGRVWLAIESWIVGPWVGLYRLARPRHAAPSDASGPTAGVLARAQLPFLVSMSLLAACWAIGARPAPGLLERLCGVIAASAITLGVSLAWRHALVERFALVAQIFILDQYFKVLMKHCSNLSTYFDPWLLSADRAVFGGWPVAMGQARGPGESEYWALVYSLFILYLFSSLFLNATGRTRAFSAAYFAGITLLYGIAYLGYVWLPARGPYCIPGLYAAGLPSGPHMDVLRQSLAYTDCYSGAFPSLHVGAVTYMLLNDWIFCRDRFWAYLPLASSIAVSTLTLRMHYFIDLVAGALLATLCVLLCIRLSRCSSSSC